MQVNRPLLKQEFTTFPLTVQTTGTPVNANMGITAMVDSFMITVPAGTANSVFLGGDQGVTITSGIELLAGTTVQFLINHDGRQQYELQAPLIDIATIVACRDYIPEAIPFVVWDMSSIFLVAVAPTAITVAIFKAMYI